MISTSGVTLRYGKRALFEDVNIKFTAGNCYGLIGANGAGKSTFLKILSGEIEANIGEVHMTPGERMAVLKQNHFEYDEYPVLETVIMGHSRLYDIMKEKDALYAKADFSEADGLRAGELEGEFAELNGWDAEPDAAALLIGLGIPRELHDKKMEELSGNEKVRVLLAQALFGRPNNLLLDEPTNHLDLESITALNNGLIDFDGTILFTSHDHQFIQTIANRIIEITPTGIIDKAMTYDEYLESEEIKALREKMYPDGL